MEEVLFIDPEVAQELREGFVEARLHCDIKNERGDRNRERQKELVGNRALPTFVVIDPDTELTIEPLLRGSAGKGKFLKFLRKARQKWSG